MARFRKGRAGARRAAAARGGISHRTSSDGRAPARRLRCEQLEDRRLLAVITVDSISDLSDASDGRTTLREAVLTANATLGSDEIVFSPGVFGAAARIELRGGELVLADFVTITGPGATLTIDALDQSRIFNFVATVGDFTVKNLTLTHGRAAAASPNGEGSPNEDCGGAIRSASSGMLTLENVKVNSCRTLGADAHGGAVYAAGSLTVVGGEFANNLTMGVDAMGGSLAAGGKLVVENSEISGSRAAIGGGIAGLADISLTGVTVTGNTAFDSERGAGGGVFAAGRLTLVNATISLNAAEVTGTNARAWGGGLYAAGDLDLRHSTIAGNTASSLGAGAIASGGGVYAVTTLTAANSIVAGNFSTEGESEIRAGSGSTTFRYSLLADNQGTPLAEAPVGQPDPQGNLVGGSKYGFIDPLIGPLAKNGGAMRTQPLLYGSPAISAGDPKASPGVLGTPQFDQRGAGFSRRNGARIDMGAVENSSPTWVVDTLVDEDDGNVAPGNLSLREAIGLANAKPDANVVEFSPALFSGTKTITLSLGELAITGAIDLRGPGANLLVIDASGNDPTPNVDNGDGSRVFTFNDPTTGPRTIMFMSGLKLVGGDVEDDGGAIQSVEILTLTSVNIAENSSAARGGGVSSTQLTLVASDVSHNWAEAGGGVFTTSYLTIERSTISHNQGATGAGGIFSIASGPGAVFSSDVIIVRSLIGENSSDGTAGGMRMEGNRLYFYDSLLRGNHGVTGGMTLSNVNFEIFNSTIAANTGRGTGGINALGTQAGRIEQSTISGNRGASEAGGIRSTQSGVLAVVHSTITDNVADSDDDGVGLGGGFDALRVSLSNSIVAGNRLGSGARSDVRASEVSAAYSLIGDRSGTTLVEAPVELPDARGNLIGGPAYGPIDPRLGPLSDNGGSLPTHALVTGSPAINAGDPAFVPGVDDAPDFDQRGAPFGRVAGLRIDLGAVEAFGGPLVVDSLVDESDGNFSKDHLSLREAIELTNQQSAADTITFSPALFAEGPATIRLTLGELSITDSLTIVGPGAELLTIDASGNDPTPSVNDGKGSRALMVDNGVPAVSLVVLEHLTVTGGDVSGNGGGIMTAEELHLADVRVSENSAVGPLAGEVASGGGVYATGPVHMHDSAIIGNEAASGGGINATSLVFVDRSLIEGNRSSGTIDSAGGILAVALGASIEIRDSTIRKNIAEAGSGGVRVESSSLTIANTSFVENRGTTGGGLGVRDGSLAISTSLISANTASQLGGGIWLASTSALISQATISGNSSLGNGGGVAIDSNRGFSMIVSTTITANRANANADGQGTGGGIYFSGPSLGPDLSHDIVAGNFSGGAAPSDLGNFASIQWPEFSLIGSNAGTALGEAPAGAPDLHGNMIGGPGGAVIDPRLGPLSDNGGPTLTHVLLPSSPAIDAGNPATGTNSEFDQRGAPYSRRVGGRVDMGAVELQAVGGTLEADFNFDGLTNGGDFLAWQRNVGRAGGATFRQGDATNDGDVDANDLAVWRARWGQGSAVGAPHAAIDTAFAVDDLASAMDMVAVAQRAAAELPVHDFVSARRGSGRLASRAQSARIFDL